MALQGFSHLGICVSDLDRSTRFYEDVLGFTQLFTVELGDEVAATMEIDGQFRSRILRRDDLRIELLHWKTPTAQGTGDRRPMNELGMTHLCFRVEDVEDLCGRAEQAGGKAHPETLSVLHDGAIKTMYLTDPDGTRIECISGQPDLGAL